MNVNNNLLTTTQQIVVEDNNYEVAGGGRPSGAPSNFAMSVRPRNSFIFGIRNKPNE
jgi:hypothetical protein